MGRPNSSMQDVQSVRKFLRGTIFRSRRDMRNDRSRVAVGDYICETCFREGRHPQDYFVKTFKHCILDEIVTPQRSRELCKCSTVSRFDQNGSHVALYPIDPLAKHRKATQGYSKCRLSLLPQLVIEERYRALIESLESRKRTNNGPLKNLPQTQKAVNGPIFKLGAALDEALDADVALPLKRYANRFPFGNTHISLMVGPLIIENGAEQ